ncbi:MAG: Uma2 family endonuclease [Pirellulales bacterium]|nr:Uma2 family endonuclease [Pirellulales bacterium]
MATVIATPPLSVAEAFLSPASLPGIPTGPVLIPRGEWIGDFLRNRRDWGGARWDEVWNGVYIMSPFPNFVHQRLLTRLAAFFENVLASRQVEVYAGLNVSDREEDWTKNFRIPDIAVLFPDNPARRLDAALVGGPDFLVEILSEDDKAAEKLEFYGRIGTRECLYLIPETRACQLYRLIDQELRLVAQSSCEQPNICSSDVLGLTFQTVGSAADPKLRVAIPPDSTVQLAVSIEI